VIITGHHRSLVTTLRASEKFEREHLSTPEVAALIDAAKFYYVTGFFLTHGIDISLDLAKKASGASKVFALNLSAPFIPQFFGVQLQQIFPYCDFIIGNDAEAAAWASANGLPHATDIPQIARSLALLPKANASRTRTVIITRGHLSTIAVSSSVEKDLREFPVNALPDDQIVDTNGAGDAFTGGFLAAYVLGKSIDESIEVGHKMGAMCVKQVGPQYSWPKENLL